LVEGARAWALLHKREHVVPEDVQAVFSPVVTHRLRYQMRGGAQMDVARVILDKVDVIG
jgi:MoxR-like ATPase